MKLDLGKRVGDCIVYQGAMLQGNLLCSLPEPLKPLLPATLETYARMTAAMWDALTLALRRQR